MPDTPTRGSGPGLQVARYMLRFAPFTAKEVAKVLSSLRERTIPAKQLLLREGEVCRHQFFILRGLLMEYHIDARAREVVAKFGKEDWWFTNLDSYRNGAPSLSHIIALEETTVLALARSDQEALFERIPRLERMFRIIAENTLISMTRRYELHMKMRGRDRYLHFTGKLPGFANRIPQYRLASYLGLSPEYLSHLRGRPRDLKAS